MTLHGKCALITGSVAGLGYAIANALAAEGCNIVLNGIAPPDEAEAARAQLEGTHGIAAIYERADVSNVGEIERLVANAARRFGSVDIVVNNAVVRHFEPVEKLVDQRACPLLEKVELPLSRTADQEMSAGL